VLITTGVGLWLGVLETIDEDELLLAELVATTTVVVCTLELDVATTATAEVVVDVVLLGNGFPFTATSLAPQTLLFTRTSPTAFFR